MKLLVTGGAGFIGSNFILYWLKQYPNDSIVKINNKIVDPENININSFSKVELDDTITINVSKKGFLSKTEQTTFRYIKNNVLNIYLIPTNKSISFITSPEQAKVYIDGEFIGKTPIMGFNTHKENFSISIIKKDYKSIKNSVLYKFIKESKK